jgi:hypothetical protein
MEKIKKTLIFTTILMIKIIYLTVSSLLAIILKIDKKVNNENI